MKLWIPMTLVGLIVLSYAFFYELSAAETQGAESIGFANSLGLLLVVVGLIAAGLLLRRATPHQ